MVVKLFKKKFKLPEEDPELLDAPHPELLNALVKLTSKRTQIKT